MQFHERRYRFSNGTWRYSWAFSTFCHRHLSKMERDKLADTRRYRNYDDGLHLVLIKQIIIDTKQYFFINLFFFFWIAIDFVIIIDIYLMFPNHMHKRIQNASQLIILKILYNYVFNYKMYVLNRKKETYLWILLFSIVNFL